MAVGTTAFPTALDTAVELVELTNNASSTLTNSITSGDTTITVDDPAEFPTSGFGTLVDDLDAPTTIEIISWTGKSGSDLTGVTRGAQGTSAAAFSAGEFIEVRPTKGHHEALRGAIIAIETKLGYGSSTSTANTVLLGNGTGTSAWGAITNAYIDASAAIAHSKMAALTASRLMVTDGSGFASVASVTATEAGYLSGVTSAIQTQLNAKAASGANTDLTSVYLNNTGLKIKDTNASHGLSIIPGSDLTADHTLTLATGDADRTLTFSGDATISGTNSGDVTLAGTPDYITISGQVITRNAVDLAADVTGNLPVANLNSGTGASGSTFWRGDGTWATPAGSGDVVGPASATDNAIARFDNTTGKLLQDSVVTIADTTGNMAGVGTLNTHTIPSGTDTFALLAASQTFTNKTLTAPDINGGTADALTSLGIRSTGSGAFDLTFANTENLAAGRTLTFTVNDAARTIDLAGNLTLAAAFITSGANSLTLTTTASTNVTLPTSGTLVNSAVTSLSSLTTVGTITTGGLGTGAVIGGVTMTLGSDGTGDIYYRSAGGVLTRLAAGTDGHVLTLASGLPSWAAASGGGLTVGTTAIASGAAGTILYETSGNVLGEIAGSAVTSNGFVTLAPTARTSGVNSYFAITTPADTGQTASTESIGIKFGGNASAATVTRTWVAGTTALQREYVFVAPTYAGASATAVFTKAATVAIDGVPLAGSNATLTTPSALYIKTNVSDQKSILLDGSSGNTYNSIDYVTSARTFSLTGSANTWYLLDRGSGTFPFYVDVGSSYPRMGIGTSSIDTSTHLRVLSSSASRVGLRVDSAASSTVTLNSFNLATNQTNAVATHSTFAVNSSGTAATGLGGRLAFTLESSTTNDQDAAAIDWLWTDATHASRTAKLTFSLVGNAAALATVAEFDMSTTATHTRMLIYDVDNAALERVSVGAPDSGGSGFKVLCIPN